MSVGYVHSLKFTTSEKIDKEFTDRYGVEPTKGVEFRTGRYEKAWVKNVASVGLSFGFIEPLEATGLASIVTNVFRLLESLSTHLSPNSFDREVFNHACATELDNSKTFIDMPDMNKPMLEIKDKNSGKTRYVNITHHGKFTHRVFNNSSWDQGLSHIHI